MKTINKILGIGAITLPLIFGSCARTFEGEIIDEHSLFNSSKIKTYQTYTLKTDKGKLKGIFTEQADIFNVGDKIKVTLINSQIKEDYPRAIDGKLLKMKYNKILDYQK
jgi:hypothetical protein